MRNLEQLRKELIDQCDEINKFIHQINSLINVLNIDFTENGGFRATPQTLYGTFWILVDLADKLNQSHAAYWENIVALMEVKQNAEPTRPTSQTELTPRLKQGGRK